MLCAGESDSEEQAISSDSEEQKRWRPATTSGRCAVCKRAKKGRCGTETAPAKCEKRAENARRPAGDRERGAGQHAHQGSAPGKHSLKRKNSWDLDDMQVIRAPKGAFTMHHEENAGELWDRLGDCSTPCYLPVNNFLSEKSFSRRFEVWSAPLSRAGQSEAMLFIAACVIRQACDVQCCVGAGHAGAFPARRQSLPAAAQQPRAARPAAGRHAGGRPRQQSAGGVAASAARAPGGRPCCGSRQCTPCCFAAHDSLHSMCALCTMKAQMYAKGHLIAYRFTRSHIAHE